MDMKAARLWLQLFALLAGLGLWILAGVPFNWFPLGFVGLAPLIWLFWQSKTPVRAGLWGLIAGLVYYGFHLFWIPGLITDMPVARWMLWAGMLLLVLYQACFWGLAAAGARWLYSRRAWVNLLALPSLWVILEYIRAHSSDASFTWANTWLTTLGDPVLMHSAALIGPFGLAWFLVLINASVAAAIERRKWGFGLGALGWLILVHGLGLLPDGTQREGEISVAIVQPNILADYSDWNRITEIYTDQASRLRDRNLDLVILSESALPGLFRYSTRGQELVRWISEQAGAPVMLATADIRGRGEDRHYYNTVFLVDTNGVILGTYDKVKLVPFGEHFPFHRMLPEAIKNLIPVVGDYWPGSKPVPIHLGKTSLGPLLCFESTFPDLSRQHVLAGAELLVNLTNDGWFGKTLGPVEHFHMARFRSVEESRYLLRCGKTGISAVIDDRGQVLQEIPGFERGIIFATVPLKRGLTPYARFGDWVAGVSALITALILGYTLTNKSRFRRKA